MTANPNSSWGCQAREFIQSVAAREHSGESTVGERASRSVEERPAAQLPAGASVPGGHPTAHPAPPNRKAQR